MPSEVFALNIFIRSVEARENQGNEKSMHGALRILTLVLVLYLVGRELIPYLMGL